MQKDGKYQEKKAEVAIMCQNGVKSEDRICKATIFVNQYVGRGSIKDSVQLTGNAQYLDFEVCVEASKNEGGTAGGDDHDSDEETRESNYSRSSTQVA